MLARAEGVAWSEPAPARAGPRQAVVAPPPPARRRRIFLGLAGERLRASTGFAPGPGRGCSRPRDPSGCAIRAGSGRSACVLRPAGAPRRPGALAGPASSVVPRLRESVGAPFWPPNGQRSDHGSSPPSPLVAFVWRRLRRPIVPRGSAGRPAPPGPTLQRSFRARAKRAGALWVGSLVAAACCCLARCRQ